MAVQLGEAGQIDFMSDLHLNDGLIAQFIEGLEAANFVSMHDYEEMHGRLDVAWRFATVLKQYEARSRWYADEAEVSLSISKRIHQTLDGKPPLAHFDGATMMTYTYPSRVVELRYCSVNPEKCGPQDVFNRDVIDHPIESFEVRSIPGVGRGVFAKHDIKKGDYCSLQDCVHQMFIPPLASALLEDGRDKLKDFEYWETFQTGYVEGYGLQNSFFVSILLLPFTG